MVKIAYWDLLVGVALYSIGLTIFNPFEIKTPFRKRISKFVGFMVIAAVLSLNLGKLWSMVWIVGMFVAGLSFHFYWTRKHGISFWRPDPKEKYYRLRGWKLES